MATNAVNILHSLLALIALSYMTMHLFQSATAFFQRPTKAYDSFDRPPSPFPGVGLIIVTIVQLVAPLFEFLCLCGVLHIILQSVWNANKL